MACEWTDGAWRPVLGRQTEGIVLSNFNFFVIVNTITTLTAVGAGCGVHQAKPAQTPTGAAAETPRAAASSALMSQPLAAPRLSLELAEMKERTGSEFGLVVPMLLVTLASQGGPAEVPQVGVDLILSLRVSLTALSARAGAAAGRTELRHATLLRPWTVQLGPLLPGEPLRQGLSPLSVERRDVPLAPGRYRVSVCVPPSEQAAYPSAFTDRFGGLCSNELELEVKRRR